MEEIISERERERTPNPQIGRDEGSEKTNQASKDRKVADKEIPGQWLWRSWQSGHFRYQRTRVRIQSSATFIEHLFTVNCV